MHQELLIIYPGRQNVRMSIPILQYKQLYASRAMQIRPRSLTVLATLWSRTGAFSCGMEGTLFCRLAAWGRHIEKRELHWLSTISNQLIFFFDFVKLEICQHVKKASITLHSRFLPRGSTPWSSDEFIGRHLLGARWNWLRKRSLREQNHGVSPFFQQSFISLYIIYLYVLIQSLFMWKHPTGISWHPVPPSSWSGALLA